MRFFRALILLLILGLQSAAAESVEIEGLVAEVQLIDVTELNEERLLILSIQDGPSLLLPGATQLAAGRGVQVAVRHLPAPEGSLPIACDVRVLALPIAVDGEEVMQPARRPFEVYRNSQAECQTP